ncbi:metal-dependent hydrolase [Candidatus Babeliales bacterium]|nr:metal-dependent hydrolase [Candidatus Babeliales bacterium]
MPNYKGHLLGGVVAWGLLLYGVRDVHPTGITCMEWLGWCLFGSLFPDIDTHSKGRKIFYYAVSTGLIYFLLAGKYQFFIALSMVSVVPFFVRHRGIFHRAWFILLCCIVPWLYIRTTFPQYVVPAQWSVLFFGIGALSHLLLDFGVARTIKRL